MKFLLCAFLLASFSQAECRHERFPYHKYIGNCHEFFEKSLHRYSQEQIFPDDLKTDEEKAIFYSGCMYSLEQIRSLERRH